MKKIIGSIFTIFSIFILSACSQGSIQENLQENNWNVVSTNGEAYTADFGSDTVTFDLQITSLGFSYSVDEEGEVPIITMEQPDSSDEAFSFSITQNDDEYKFTAENDDVYEQYGDLTLSPVEAGQDQSEE